MNAAFAVNLAKVREAAELTQKKIAEAMGRDVSGVSRIEGRQDILLSTLAEYLAAAGVQAAALVLAELLDAGDYTRALQRLDDTP